MVVIAGCFLSANPVEASSVPIINELSPYPQDDIDWVELYNLGDSSIDIGGWILNNSDSGPTIGGPNVTFTAGTVIPAGGYLVVEKGVGANKFGFDLKHYETHVTLYKPDLTIASKLIYIGDPGTDHSWGLYPNGTGIVTNFAILTKGASNGGEDTVPPVIPGNPGWGKSIPPIGYAGDGVGIDGFVPCGGYLKNDGAYRRLWGQALDDSGINMYQIQEVKDGSLIYSGGELTNYTGTFIPGVSDGASEGNYYVRVRAIDTYGNASISDAVWADTSPYLSWCKMTIDITPPATTDSLLDSLWRKEDVLVNLTCSDNFGCFNTYYTLDGENPTNFSNSGTSFSVTTDGIYNLKYFSVDNAGNSEEVKTSANVIKLDKTKPNNVPTEDFGEWVNNPNLTFQWPESLDGTGSGVSYYQFWLSTAGNETNALDLDFASPNKWKYVGNVLTYTLTNEEAALLSLGSTYYAKVKAVDNAGNTANTYSSSWSDGIRLDTQTPSSLFTSPSAGFYNAAGWSGDISGTATDDDSGVSKVELKVKVVTALGENKYWNGADFDLSEHWLTAAGTGAWDYSFTPIEGGYVIYYKAYDNAGNIETANEASGIVFDKTAPQVSHSLSSVSPATITISAVEDNLDKIEYQYDSEAGVWLVYSQPLISIEGGHTFYYRALDKAGNTSSTKSFVVKFLREDTESPLPVDNLRAEAFDSLVVLEWDFSPSLDVDYYRIYKSENKKFIPNPETRFAEVSFDVGSYDDEDVENDTTYYYYVVAFDTAGNNSSAEGVSAKPSKEEEEVVVEEIPNLELPQGAVLGVEEKLAEAETAKFLAPKMEKEINPNENNSEQGNVLAVEDKADEEVASPLSVWDFWWVILIIFGIGGIGFYAYRKR